MFLLITSNITQIWRDSLQNFILLQGGALFRIESVKSGRDETDYECAAENRVGDVVTAKATLHVYDGKFFKYFFFTKNK